MRGLLRVTAVIEATTGLALIATPALVVRLLLGGELAGVGLALGRVAGFALLSLGVACWPARAATVHVAAVRAMLTYNPLAMLWLAWLGLAGEWVGRLLWPAVMLHAVLTVLLTREWLKSLPRTQTSK